MLAAILTLLVDKDSDGEISYDEYKVFERVAFAG